MNVHMVSFWSAMAFLVLGMVLGIIGIWVEDFWRNSIGSRLLWTDAVLFGTALAGAIIAKWLT